MQCCTVSRKSKHDLVYFSDAWLFWHYCWSIVAKWLMFFNLFHQQQPARTSSSSCLSTSLSILHDKYSDMLHSSLWSEIVSHYTTLFVLLHLHVAYSIPTSWSCMWHACTCMCAFWTCGPPGTVYYCLYALWNMLHACILGTPYYCMWTASMYITFWTCGYQELCTSACIPSEQVPLSLECSVHMYHT